MNDTRLAGSRLDGGKEEVNVFKLGNGIPVFYNVVPDARTASIALGCKAGAFFEEGFGQQSNDGISHFLEHMFFKGTPDLSTREVNEVFTRMGAVLNAYTSYDHTMYFSKVPRKHLSKAATTWGNLMMGIMLDPLEFESERKVVMQEEKLGRDDPMAHAGRRVHHLLFKGTTLEHDIIGSPESLGAITIDMMEEYIASRYNPTNTAIAISGGFMLDEMKSLLNDLFSREPAIPRKLSTSQDHEKINPNWKPGSTIEREPKNRPLCYIAASWAVQGDIEAMYYPMKLVDMLIDNGKNSLFYTDIVSKGICGSASFYYDSFQDVMKGTIMYAAEPSRVEFVHDTIMGTMKKAKDMPITEDLLERLKKEIIGKRLLAFESSLIISTMLVRNKLCRDAVESPAEVIASLDNVDGEIMQSTRNAFLDGIECAIHATGNLPPGWEPSNVFE